MAVVQDDSGSFGTSTFRSNGRGFSKGNTLWISSSGVFWAYTITPGQHLTRDTSRDFTAPVTRSVAASAVYKDQAILSFFSGTQVLIYDIPSTGPPTLATISRLTLDGETTGISTVGFYIRGNKLWEFKKRTPTTGDNRFFLANAYTITETNNKITGFTRSASDDFSSRDLQNSAITELRDAFGIGDVLWLRRDGLDDPRAALLFIEAYNMSTNSPVRMPSNDIRPSGSHREQFTWTSTPAENGIYFGAALNHINFYRYTPEQPTDVSSPSTSLKIRKIARDGTQSTIELDYLPFGHAGGGSDASAVTSVPAGWSELTFTNLIFDQEVDENATLFDAGGINLAIFVYLIKAVKGITPLTLNNNFYYQQERVTGLNRDSTRDITGWIGGRIAQSQTSRYDHDIAYWRITKVAFVDNGKWRVLMLNTALAGPRTAATIINQLTDQVYIGDPTFGAGVFGTRLTQLPATGENIKVESLDAQTSGLHVGLSRGSMYGLGRYTYGGKLIDVRETGG